MGVTTPYLNALTLTKRRLNIIAKKAVKDNEKEIIALIRDEQLEKGVDAFGKRLIHPTGGDGTYRKVTEEYWTVVDPPRPSSNTKKKRGTRYNMEWTGKTKDSLKLKVANLGFDILSSTKAAIEALYDTEMIRLSEEHLQIVNDEYVVPELYKEIFGSFNKLL